MNDYCLYEVIGSGHFSNVYRGRKNRTLEYLAIKRIDRGQRATLMEELEFILGLSHPHIIDFKGWYETRNNIWSIFEYCPGCDLQSFVFLSGTHQSLPLITIKAFMLDILSGLQVCP